MTPISIAKVLGSASAFVAACGAALVLGVTHVQHEERLEGSIVTSATSPAQPAPVVRTEGSPALAATTAEAAAVTAELARPPSTPAPDQSAPSFDVARTEATGDAVIAGRAAPGALVDLLGGGERLDRVVADASGQFVMVPPRLPAGSYELTLKAKLPDGTEASSKQGVMVTVADAGANPGATQLRAESVPATASRAAPPPQLPLQAAKPQENAALEATQAIAAGSAPDQGLSSPAAAPRTLTRVVSRGDSLWRISRITYGDGTRYATVYRANRDRIRDPNLIHPGQILFLPAKRH
jgi:nucleoid-associated protein YgaU